MENCRTNCDYALTRRTWYSDQGGQTLARLLSATLRFVAHQTGAVDRQPL